MIIFKNFVESRKFSLLWLLKFRTYDKTFPTWAKFFQLIANLSVVLPQLNLAKLKLE